MGWLSKLFGRPEYPKNKRPCGYCAGYGDGDCNFHGHGTRASTVMESCGDFTERTRMVIPEGIGPLDGMTVDEAMEHLIAKATQASRPKHRN